MSKRRQNKHSTDSGVGFESRLVAKKQSQNGSESVRVADDQRQSVTADLEPDGRGRYEIKGASSQNEAGVLHVCALLAERLRKERPEVGQPRKATGRERGVDCDIPVGAAILQVQVTRPATRDVWKTLNTTGMAERELSAASAVEDLLALVEHKAARTALQDRSRITLALDATDTALHAMDQVVRSFREQHSERLRSIGFESVWVVGPESDSVYQLDVS